MAKACMAYDRMIPAWMIDASGTSAVDSALAAPLNCSSAALGATVLFTSVSFLPSCADCMCGGYTLDRRLGITQRRAGDSLTPAIELCQELDTINVSADLILGA